MKRNILIVIVSVILVSLGAMVTYKIFNDKIISSISFSRQGKIDTNYFKLVLPLGWETQEPAPENLILKATYLKSNSQDPLARKMNYKSNLSIAHKTLEGNTLSEYIAILNKEIKANNSDTTIHSEGETIFNNNQAYLIDTEGKNNNIKCKNIIGVIQGKHDDVWIITLNTPQLDWDSMAFQFYGVLNSFQLK